MNEQTHCIAKRIVHSSRIVPRSQQISQVIFIYLLSDLLNKKLLSFWRNKMAYIVVENSVGIQFILFLSTFLFRSFLEEMSWMKQKDWSKRQGVDDNACIYM